MSLIDIIMKEELGANVDGSHNVTCEKTYCFPISFLVLLVFLYDS
jgi:hypothetical protein